MEKSLQDDFNEDYKNGDISAALAVYNRILVQRQNEKSADMLPKDLEKIILK